MRRHKSVASIVALLSLFICALFFIQTSSADEELPNEPTIVGWGYDYWTINSTFDFGVALYNPAVNEAENDSVGEKICSVETSLTFPKDILEIQSVDFTQDENSSYSNEQGTLNFKGVLPTCNTRIVIDLFNVTFKTKQLGTGVIHFSSSRVVGGSNESTVLSSGVYEDFSINVVPLEEYTPDTTIEDPLPDVSAGIPQPQVTTSTTTRPSASSSASATAKTATKTENSTYKVPNLTNLEFSVNAVLDKASKRSQGVLFTGTAEPNSKVYILIHSQTEVFTDTTSAADGTWTKNIDSWLEDGAHTITVWSEKDNKISSKFSSLFVISSYAKDQIAIGDTYPEVATAQAASTVAAPKKESKLSTLVKNKFFWVYVGGGVILIAIVIILIARSRKKKNDDSGDDISNGEAGGLQSMSLPPSFSENPPAQNVPTPNVPVTNTPEPDALNVPGQNAPVKNVASQDSIAQTIDTKIE